jgi:RHS repeat-associated protein
VAILDQVEESGRVEVRTSWVLGDHLGSTEVVTDGSGAVLERLSFDAFGLKRNAETWADLPVGSVQPRSGYTRQGYTGHEQLESVGLIHMGGRVYDPMLGRFTSADPVVQAPENLQSHNRYSYCVNNPLSLTDPSGYSWLSKGFKKIGNFFSKAAKKIGRWFKQNWRQVVVVVVAIVVACVTYGYGLSLVGGANATFAAKAAVVTASGAASGATRGGLSAALYGGSASDIFKASLRGAVVGGATAALTFGVAHGGVNGDSIFGTSIWADGATIAAEAAIGGAGSVAEGGDFLSGAIGSLGGALGELSGGNFMVRTAIAAAAGGTAAEIGGGSFENGAISAAYTYMFNHAAEQGADIEIIKSAKTETGYGLIDGIQDGLSVLGLVPFAGDVVDGINALIYLARGQHAEAAMSAAAMVPFGGIVSTGLRLSKRVGKLFKAKFSRTPKSLMDQMVLDAAKQGKGVKIIDSLGDPKFKGMEKWSYTKKSAAGLRSEVHYVRNPKTGELMDFKFKHHAETYK